MFTQLNPTLPVCVPDRGPGYAIGVIDYSQEHTLIFVVCFDDDGEIWCVPQTLVRGQINMTMGRSSTPAGDADGPHTAVPGPGSNGFTTSTGLDDES